MSRLAFGPFAFYGNGALIVPALGSGLAIYALWSWILRAGRPRLELLWSVLGVHLGLGIAVFATGGTSIEGLFFTGVLCVLPAAAAACGGLTLLERRRAPGARTSSSAPLLTVVVVVGRVLAVFPSPPLGVGVITGAFIALGRRAGSRATVGVGALLIAVLLAAGLAAPLL